ncbi:ImmA/IrrE family metallo-endopeptidase, partial [Lactobacillus sp. XV13L]|nr:ImmA/IrrE family metallo-endopeptidase [Lactobacillus sp. XV13L]
MEILEKKTKVYKMSSTFNGKRLREARYYNSLSITQLADELSISKQMVSKYENGQSSPSLENLFKIMKTLCFPKEFFYDDYNVPLKTGGTFYRSLLTSTQKQKAPSNVLMQAASIYRDFLDSYVEFPSEDNIDLSSYSPEVAAQKLRNYWNLGDKPIRNMLNLMESHGLTIIFLPDKMEKVDAFGSYRMVRDNRYYIVAVRKNTSFFKEQFSLAHELAHKVLHANVWNPADLDNYEYRIMEKQANKFASAFLLPMNSFIESVKNVD